MNNTYYYLYNGHGDVVQVVNTSGNTVNSYDYDVWGNFLEKSETNCGIAVEYGDNKGMANAINTLMNDRELYEKMRFVYTNAYTLAELRKMQTVANIEVEPTVDFSEYELLPEYKSKVGRNDPCPCGSGKKYKKCCGRGK